MARNALALSVILGLASLLVIQVCGDNSRVGQFSAAHYYEQMRQLQAFKASLIGRDSVSGSAISPSLSSARQLQVFLLFLVILLFLIFSPKFPMTLLHATDERYRQQHRFHVCIK